MEARCLKKARAELINKAEEIRLKGGFPVAIPDIRIVFTDHNTGPFFSGLGLDFRIDHKGLGLARQAL